MPINLHPCPCCGGNALLEQDFHRGFDRRLLPYSQVRCEDCSLTIKRPTADGEVVRLLWNRRHLQMQSVADVAWVAHKPLEKS